MWLAYLQLALSMAFVGMNISIGKAIVEHVPVFLFSELRFLLALLVLLPVVAFRGEWRETWRLQQGKALFGQAFFGIFLFSICMLYGVSLTSATSAGIITSTIPACIALLSYVLLKERLAGHQRTAILLSVAGITLITFATPSTGSSVTGAIGNLLVFLAVISEALFTIYAKRASAKISPVQMTVMVNLISLLLFLPLSVWDLFRTDLHAIPGSIWLLIVYYALTASVFSFILWYRGVARVPASTAGLFTGVMPISAALVSVLYLGERFTWFHGLGMLLVLAAIVAGTNEKKQEQAVGSP